MSDSGDKTGKSSSGDRHDAGRGERSQPRRDADGRDASSWSRISGSAERSDRKAAPSGGSHGYSGKRGYSGERGAGGGGSRPDRFGGDRPRQDGDRPAGDWSARGGQRSGVDRRDDQRPPNDVNAPYSTRPR